MDNQELGSFAGQEPSSNLPAFVKMPLGVRIIAGYGYISAGLQILLGALIVLLGGKLANLVVKFPTINMPLLGSGLLIAIGLLFVISGIFSWYIFRSLSKGKNWARLIVITFCGITLIASLLSSIMLDTWVLAVLPVLINGGILVYMFSSQAQTSFNSVSKKVFTKEFGLALLAFVLIYVSIGSVGWLSLKNTRNELQKAVQTVAPKSSEDCAAARSEYYRDYCYTNLAIKTNDFSFCQKITGETSSGEKANCYGNQAGATKDLNACILAVDIGLCMSAATASIARYIKSPAECDIFLSPSPELLTALRKEEANWAEKNNVNNLSSSFEGENLASSLSSWKNSCLRSLERASSKP